MPTTLDITAIDNFCGAGGSTSGLKAAGIRVVHAANHWDRAIETHNTNHPEVDHSCVDLHNADPRYFPRTTLAWFSIECTTFSPSGGRKRKNPGQMHLWESKVLDPSTERSRMGAWDVVRFSEYHRYEIVIVENVVEFLEWELHDVWLAAMHKLDYAHQLVCFNSMFAGVPQSRDRIYVVFHRKGNRKPNVDFHPLACCPEHGEINALQAWKNPIKQWGKYGKRNQYLYCCPICGIEVIPYRRPARNAIDWTLPIVKIGDREAQGLRPLSPNTLKRIEKGLKRFVVPYLLHQGHWGENRDRSSSVEQPSPTVTTWRNKGLVQLVIKGGRKLLELS
jgi:DNA (cytosine-5)-methyltransferase 1